MRFTYSGIILNLPDHQCFYEAIFELNIFIITIIITTIIIIAMFDKVLSHNYVEAVGI